MRVGGMHGGLGWQVHTEVRVLGRWLQHRELYPVSAARRPTRERIRMHVRPRKTGGLRCAAEMTTAWPIT